MYNLQYKNNNVIFFIFFCVFLKKKREKFRKNFNFDLYIN